MYFLVFSDLKITFKNNRESCQDRISRLTQYCHCSIRLRPEINTHRYGQALIYLMYINPSHQKIKEKLSRLLDILTHKKLSRNEIFSNKLVVYINVRCLPIMT